MKLTACSSRPISMVAMLMNMTTSPMVANPFRCSQVPRRKIAVTVIVAVAASTRKERMADPIGTQRQV